MSAKYIILFLSAFLLVQFSCGKSSTSTKDSVESSTTLSPQTKLVPSDMTAERTHPTSKLLQYMTNELYILIDIIFQGEQKMLQAVVAQTAVKEEKGQLFSKRLDEISKLADNLKRLKLNQGRLTEEEKMRQKINAIKELKSLMSPPKYASDDQLFRNLQYKPDFQKIERELQENTDKFVTGAVRIWNSLSSEEKERDYKFAEWFKNYKPEENMEKKREMFKALFTIFLADNVNSKK